MLKMFVVIEKYVCFDGSLIEKRVGFFNTLQDAEWVVNFSTEWNKTTCKGSKSTFEIMDTLQWAEEWGWNWEWGFPEGSSNYYCHSK